MITFFNHVELKSKQYFGKYPIFLLPSDQPSVQLGLANGRRTGPAALLQRYIRLIIKDKQGDLSGFCCFLRTPLKSAIKFDTLSYK
ncbi:hypothetical protein H206_00649 [Candidatus Electrothrix aarhusensis]|uniref:Uncharacterized protein n=1 Tax=Candidatus Electrothrix aarhusensis TaxID=1859131 RepID=A0A3S3QRR9_9BACT|nr:hypothetical protein H206_00649 [Candidatus Electrothrix aarhusensis]